ncbi:MAG: laccase domain-containing protein, partial [Massilia sp.]|nr:laccase domain-containing protein [Massilia sp.]
MRDLDLILLSGAGGWPDLPPNVGALATTRCGGTSAGPFGDAAGRGGLNLGGHVGDDPQAVARNRSLLRERLPCRPVWISQVHGVDVVQADSVAEGDPVPTADASIATRHGVACTILTADCLPVLFADLDGR